MKVLITGATGFIGQALVKKLSDHHLTILSRNTELAKVKLGSQHQYSDDLASIDISGIDAVINLAGEPIAEGRWTPAKKQAICNSRWGITETLATKIKQSSTPPKVLINASAIGIYGARGTDPVDEETPIEGTGFPEQICQRWEQLANGAASDKTRVCIVRVGLVMHPSGGALKKMLPPFRLGLGGPLGDGKQMMSWIHRDDLVEMFLFLLRNENCEGVFNGTAPNPVNNQSFTRSLGRALGRPAFLPAPAWAMQLAFGEMSELLLTGQAVLPHRSQQAGFVFDYPDLDGALKTLL